MLKTEYLQNISFAKYLSQSFGQNRKLKEGP